MRTVSPSREGSLDCWIDWKRSAIVTIAVGVLLALVGCTASPGESVDHPFVASYAGAANRLSGMEPAEAQEQLRDWAQTALASHLDLDAARFRDALYDVMPVREAGFTDLSRRHCQVVQRWGGRVVFTRDVALRRPGQAAAGTPTTSFQAVNRVSISWR
jgi:hypothetical protein